MKWISVLYKLPKPCQSVLFCSSTKTYSGWLETYIPEEDPLWHCTDGDAESWPTGITHWMYFPNPCKTKPKK